MNINKRYIVYCLLSCLSITSYCEGQVHFSLLNPSNVFGYEKVERVKSDGSRVYYPVHFFLLIRNDTKSNIDLVNKGNSGLRIMIHDGSNLVIPVVSDSFFTGRYKSNLKIESGSYHLIPFVITSEFFGNEVNKIYSLKDAVEISLEVKLSNGAWVSSGKYSRKEFLKYLPVEGLPGEPSGGATDDFKL